MNWELIIGAVGAVTGIVSLVWHLLNSRPKIILESVIFNKGGHGLINARGHTHIGVRINLRNKGSRSTTIESLKVFAGDKTLPSPFWRHTPLPANSSKDFGYDFPIPDDEYKTLFIKGKIKLGVEIKHTFGNIKKEGETNLKAKEFILK